MDQDKQESRRVVPILHMVNRPVAGLVVDIRTVRPDGTLWYPHQEADGPIMVTLRRVEVVRKGGYNWLRWEWDGWGCGYSGVRLDAEDVDLRCLWLPNGKRGMEV